MKIKFKWIKWLNMLVVEVHDVGEVEIEWALVNSQITNNKRFLFSPYRVEARLTYNDRTLLKNMIFEAILQSRRYKKDDLSRDDIIADVCANKVDTYFRGRL